MTHQDMLSPMPVPRCHRAHRAVLGMSEVQDSQRECVCTNTGKPTRTTTHKRNPRPSPEPNPPRLPSLPLLFCLHRLLHSLPPLVEPPLRLPDRCVKGIWSRRAARIRSRRQSAGSSLPTMTQPIRRACDTVCLVKFSCSVLSGRLSSKRDGQGSCKRVPAR